MSSVNIYKIEEEKQQAFLQMLTTKWSRRNTVMRRRLIGETRVEIGLTLYTIVPDDEKPITWNWLLAAFGESEINNVASPKAIVLIEHGDNMYVVTYGYSYFHVDKYSDKNFAFDFARRLNYSNIKTTTLTTPNSQRNKIVNSYIEYDNFEFDSGESFAKIKAKVSIPQDFTLYNEVVEIGSSIKFSVGANSLDKLVDIVLHIEDTIENKPCRVDFPVFYKIPDKEELAELDTILQESINTGGYQIQFSEIDIIGANEVFNHNDATFRLRYNGVEKVVGELTQNQLQAFCEENEWNLNTIVLDVKVIFYRNGESICTKSVKELIEYTISERRCILSQGIWYRYNDDYLRYLTISLSEIEVMHFPEYNFSCSAHDIFIEEKYALEVNNEEYAGKPENEVKGILKKKYYAEKYYNIMMSEINGFDLYDRDNARIGTANIELMDLYKDNCMYAVKIGKASEKLCYVVDQSIQSLKVYKHNLTDEKPHIDSVALIIILERASQLPLINGKPDINDLDMLTLKNKLDYWKKQVRIQGYKPKIYINYKVD